MIGETGGPCCECRHRIGRGLGRGRCELDLGGGQVVVGENGHVRAIGSERRSMMLMVGTSSGVKWVTSSIPTAAEVAQSQASRTVQDLRPDAQGGEHPTHAGATGERFRFGPS